MKKLNIPPENYKELVDSSTEILKSLVSETRSVDAFQTHRLKLALELNGVNTDELDIK